MPKVVNEQVSDDGGFALALKSAQGLVDHLSEVVPISGISDAQQAKYQKYLQETQASAHAYLSSLESKRSKLPQETQVEIESFVTAFQHFEGLQNLLNLFRQQFHEIAGEFAQAEKQGVLPISKARASELEGKLCGIMQKIQDQTKDLIKHLDPLPPNKTYEKLAGLTGFLLGAVIGPFKYAFKFFNEGRSLGEKLEGLVGGFLGGAFLGAGAGYKAGKEYYKEYRMHDLFKPARDDAVKAVSYTKLIQYGIAMQQSHDEKDADFEKQGKPPASYRM